ncbi:MAG: hypothetical protein D6698_15750 [Gammaproteobacteria bacterium]|nr:MAG: hypothetical protein D6698_15750 [Gammaproteobacteria bacterium]
MFKITRFKLMQWHALLACFFLPIAATYFIGGVLYTLDIKGHTNETTLKIELDEPFSPNLDDVVWTVREALEARKLPVPESEPILSKKKNRYVFVWKDLKNTVSFSQKAGAKRLLVKVKQRSFLAQLMQFHTANAGTLFKAIAVLMVSALMLILISGVWMAQSTPALKKQAWTALGVGSLALILLLINR